MGLRNLVKGDYYCAQNHAHSNNSEVDKCNEVYKLRIKQDNEKEIQLARIRAEGKKEEERTQQMKYYAEAARDIRIAQLKAGNNNALTFAPQPQPVGNGAKALPWHGATTTSDTKASRQITASLAGTGNLSRQSVSTGSYGKLPGSPSRRHSMGESFTSANNRASFSRIDTQGSSVKPDRFRNDPTLPPGSRTYTRPSYTQSTYTSSLPNRNPSKPLSIAQQTPSQTSGARKDPFTSFGSRDHSSPSDTQSKYTSLLPNRSPSKPPSIAQPPPSQTSGRVSRPHVSSRQSYTSAKPITSSGHVVVSGSDSYHSSQQSQTSSYRRTLTFDNPGLYRNRNTGSGSGFSLGFR